MDGSVDGIGTPQCSAWPTDDFDPINILEWEVLHFPEHTSDQGGIHGSSINQD